MDLKAPRPGERRILASRYKRQLIEQDFFYADADGKERTKPEVYSLWTYGGKSPAILFPVTTDGKLIAAWQFRHALKAFMFETPGGCSEEDESPETTARRELLSETGYEPSEIIPFAPIWPDGVSLEVNFYPMFCFGCKKVSEPALDPTETMETRLIPLAEWYQMIYGGKIIDCKFLALSLLALPLLKSRLDFGL